MKRKELKKTQSTILLHLFLYDFGESLKLLFYKFSFCKHNIDKNVKIKIIIVFNRERSRILI